jgi:hypothetical protein
MRKIEEFKQSWEKSWNDREQMLTKKIETVQIISEKNQVYAFIIL